MFQVLSPCCSWIDREKETFAHVLRALVYCGVIAREPGLKLHGGYGM